MKPTITIQKSAKMTATGIHTNKNSKAIFCLTTGKVYASGLDTARETGCSKSHISYACTTGRTCKGMRFCFVSDIMEHLEEMAECIRKAKAYDEIIAQKEAIKKANEDFAKYKASCEKLSMKLEKEKVQLRIAEERLARLATT